VKPAKIGAKPIRDHQQHRYDRSVEASELRVVLVDDHDMFRAALRTLLEDHGPIRVVGEASNGEGGVDLARELTPDVVIMDLSMPGRGGVEATRQIVAESPYSAVVVLTVSDDAGDVVDAIVAGACGYLLKSASADELAAGIRAAATGNAIISPTIAARLLRHVREAADPARERADMPHLSTRELEVLRLVAAGRDNAEIAAVLEISPKTVKNHISNILMKLQMQNRIQAAVFAVRRGIV
jgi:two-component system, NarL family, nitrate/nitrite response regulator NarL